MESVRLMNLHKLMKIFQSIFMYAIENFHYTYIITAHNCSIAIRIF